MSAVASSIKHIGLTKLANRFGYRASAVQRWRDDKRLPQTELAGTTNYAATIEEMTNGQYTALQLIEETRARWKLNPPKRRGVRKKTRAAS